MSRATRPANDFWTATNQPDSPRTISEAPARPARPRELSDLALAEALAPAKAIYEALHPEARHGCAKKDAKFASFLTFAAGRTGLSKRTIHNRVDAGLRLTTLDAEARSAVSGTALANQLGTLVRIAAIPKPEIQRDLVRVFDRQRSAAKAELAKWELEFGLAKEPRAKRDPTKPRDCPFCGDDYQLTLVHCDDTCEWICENCYTSGPRVHSDEEGLEDDWESGAPRLATERWNTRGRWVPPPGAR